MKKNLFYTVLLLFLSVSIFHAVHAQKVLEAKPSPMVVAATKVDGAYVKIVYSQPQKRDRKIFGALVPYDKVWRLGANEATEITLTQDMTFGGQKLSAGTYSMYAIPEKDQWILIFNSALGEWGAYNYEESKDVMRIKVPTQKTDETYEPFTMMFNEDGTELMMMWDNTKVVVPVGVSA